MAHRMPIAAIERNIERDLDVLKKSRWADSSGKIHRVVPESSWGEVKTILAWLRGNEASTTADFFVISMKKGPLAFRREFYIDDRHGGGPVQNAYSNGRIGRRDVNAALKLLFTTQGELAKLITPQRTDYLRSNPKAGSGKIVAILIRESVEGGLDRPRVKSGRWSALAFDYKGAVVNLINGGQNHSRADVLSAAKKAWPTAKQVTKMPSRSNPKGKTMSKKRRKTTTTTVKTTVKTTKTRRANPVAEATVQHVAKFLHKYDLWNKSVRFSAAHPTEDHGLEAKGLTPAAVRKLKSDAVLRALYNADIVFTTAGARGEHLLFQWAGRPRFRSNPTHKRETTKGGRRLRPSAGSVRKSAKLLAARRAALAAGVKPPTRSGDLDYRAAQWKLQMARKKAAAKRRRAASRGTSKPRRSRASKPVKPRYDSLASTLNAVADRWR